MKGLIQKADDNLPVTDAEVVTDVQPVKGDVVKKQDDKPTLKDAVVSNFPKILDLASDILDIIGTKVKTSAEIAKMEQTRLNLIAETEKYVKEYEAETHRKLSKIDKVSLMLRDYNNCVNPKMTSADFTKVISDIIEKC